MSVSVSRQTATPARLGLLLIPLLALGLSSCDLFRRTLGVPDDCDRYRRDVAFATSDDVVRGTWTGTLEGWPTAAASRGLTLELDATYEDSHDYLLDGTFELEGEPALPLSGSVSGGCAERYLAGGADAAALTTESLPPPASLAAVAVDGGRDAWRITASWGGFVHGARDPATLDVRVTRADGIGGDLDQVVPLTRTAVP